VSRSKLEGLVNRSSVDKLRITFFGFFRAMALRMICATWRKHVSGLDALDLRLANKESLILVFWHGKYFTLLPLLRNRQACVFTSLSSRGDVILDILNRFGFIGVQLPNNGHENSLDMMRWALSDGKAAAIAVDGPLGPFHVVHRGAIQLASELGHRLVPASVASSPKRIISSRWDKFEMPRLFARVYLVIGEPITIPPDLDRQAVQWWAQLLHEKLESVDLQAATNLA
jgi:lysophospholipid acyltransferase (LPLAT)-like uncharacterized protein